LKLNNIAPHLALIGVNLIYGANYVIAKEVTPLFIKPFGLVCIRVTGGLLLFSIFHFFFVRESVERKDIPKLIICGFFGVVLNQLLFLKGLSLTSPINASLIMITTPILVMVMASFLIKEKITLNKALGIGLGALGVLIIQLQGEANVSGDLLGDLFIFLNAASYALYLVLVKPLMNKYSPFTVLKWIFGIGFPLVWMVGFQEFSMIEWTDFPTGIWAALGYIVVGTTFLTYLLNMFALKRVNPSLVGIYIYTQPIIAAFIAVSLGKESLSPVKLIAGGLIFLGVYLVSRKKEGKLNKDSI